MGSPGPLLPAPKQPDRPSKWPRRQLIDGTLVVRTGALWRDVPECYGSWQAVQGLFRRWQGNGTRAQILVALQTRADAVGLITRDVNVGSTIMRAHRHAAGARRRLARGGCRDGHRAGRSLVGSQQLARRVVDTVHPAYEQEWMPLPLVVTAGRRGDAPPAPGVGLLAHPRSFGLELEILKLDNEISLA
ncbi:transposase [Actinomadura nitritigenes]|uniref:transposase n=1 Tax=Actinomadura nitritigenes TaxID=134602 RepID=UPI003D915C20